VTAQELLEAINKAQNETDLDQVAVWALARYLQGVWKDVPGKNIRPYDLGQALSGFFVDLSQHRLPEKITKQTPQTEAVLAGFFGTAEGSKSHFWRQCIEIWSVVLEQDPAYAKEVMKYFDMLLRSSLQGNRLDPAAAPVRPPTESKEKPLKPHVSASAGELTPAPASPVPVVPEPPVEPAKPVASELPVEPARPAVPEPPVEPAKPVAGEPIKKPGQAGDPVLSTRKTGPLNPLQVSTPSVTLRETGPLNPAQAPVSAGSEPESKTLPRNAYLVLQGTRVIPLNRSLIKIGRQLDNHIILEDPRVSRSHAQIKLINDRFVIFDLHSTGGTYVNGQITDQSVLYPGDVVSLAGVVFIFSQEMPAKPGDMKIIELGSPFAADRPTAILQREDMKSPRKMGTKPLPDLPKTGPLK
jgi:pSer/pThr/pTyr-binding forkhead associated (FHA) protein